MFALMDALISEERSPYDPMIVWLAVVAGVAILLFGLYIAFGSSFEDRRDVRLAMAEGADMREAVAAFQRRTGRWPRADESGEFRADPSRLNHARSIVFDAGRRAVVVTMRRQPYTGRSFAFIPDDATPPRWSCKPIDLDAKYLPESCR